MKRPPRPRTSPRRWEAHRFIYFSSLFGCALGLTACSQEPGAGLTPFPSDGVSGFGRPALVDVCIGPARVAPGNAAAVCVPGGAAFTACASDLECAGTERCLCGRCFVRACDAGTVCPAGEACRGGRCTAACTADGDCAAGERCNGGGCARPCAADGDCLSGETCDFFGSCAAEACSAAAACGSGYTCEPVTTSGDIREPAVVEIAGERIAFFELRAAAGSAVYRARFTDPLHLVADPATPVLTAPPGRTSAGAPGALVSDDQVDLLVAVDGGAAIALATSSDGGRTFAFRNESLLLPAEPWETGSIGSPAPFQHDGAAYFFYEAGPGAGIGLAKLQGTSAERLTAGPVITPADLEDASFWRSVHAVGSPFALPSGDAVRLYVTARGSEGGTAGTPSGPVQPAPNDSIGMLATTDLETFERYPSGPVYTTVSGLYGALGEREPAVILHGDGADLYFVATDAEGDKVSGLSRAATTR